MAPQGTSKKLRPTLKSRKQRAKELRSLRAGQHVGAAGVEHLEQRYLLAAAPLVNTLTPTNSGFTVDFSEEVDRSVLNLYDTETGGLGAADVTLVGDTTGNVLGSLVIDASGTQVTFVATGSALPSDHYTVTLRSADDGFKSAADGALLDGDGNSTPGDDFVGTFDIAADNAVVVSIPDFARGPGQDVDLDLAEVDVILPVTMSNGIGVRSVDMTIEYDPALISFPASQAVRIGRDVPNTQDGDNVFVSDAVADTTVPGVITIAGYSYDPLDAGRKEFLQLVGAVPANAPLGAVQSIRITSVSLNEGEIASKGDDGVHVVAPLGDNNASFMADDPAGTTYDVGDAALPLRIVVGLDTGLVRYPTVDPVIVADINVSGAIDTGDSALGLQEVVGLDPDKIPDLPAAVPPPVAPAPQLQNAAAVAVGFSIPQDLTAVAGTVVTVPIILTNGETALGARAELAYSTTELEFVAARGGDLFGGAAPTVNSSTPGELRLAVSMPNPVPAGVDGEVFLVDFRVLDGINVGTEIPVDLTLALANDGLVDLETTPVPVAGDDPTDGLITVVPAPDPFSFDFVLPGETDALTALAATPGETLMLEVRARNTQLVGMVNSVSNFSLDFGDSDAPLLPATGFSANSSFSIPADGDISDNTVTYVSLSALTTGLDDLLLGTVTIVAPNTDGDYLLALADASQLNGANMPSLFNDLTITVSAGATSTYDFSAADYTDDETDADHTAVVTINRSGDISAAETVFVSLAGGAVDPATPVDDFGAGPIQVDFAADQDTATFNITIIGDDLPEADETIALAFDSFSAGGMAGTTQATATLTILDDDALVAPAVVINEIDADTPGNDDAEFIELYDGGTGNTDLTGLYVVIYNGSDDQSTRTIDLTGQSTDANGFFLIGNPGVAGAVITFPNGVLQNGIDGVGLYFGNPADIPNGTPVTSTDLIDAVVFGSGQSDGTGLVATLISGQTPVMEDANGTADTDAVARRPDGGAAFDMSLYVAQMPTPGATNVFAVNADPVATDDTYTTDEDSALTGGNVITDDTGNGADSDGDNDTLSVSAVNGNAGDVGNQIALASGALLTINPDGTFEYDPNGQYEDLPVGLSTTETFNYTISDGNGGTDTATVSVTIQGVNDAPVASDDSYSGDVNAPIVGNVLTDDTGNGPDSDVDITDTPMVSEVNGVAGNVGAAVTLASGATVTLLADGSMTVDTSTSTVGPGATVTDTFTYTIDDSNGGTDTATVSVVIRGGAANNQPVATDDAYTTDEDTATGGNVITDDTGNGADSDGDNDTLSVSAVNGNAGDVGNQIALASGALLTINPDG
ncbi:MAG: cadherin-like domain-containing protein, partial [Planctomycetales bacterium]|nr:cadherin-like domain-containing protein [Planctomycetales bacterium]